MTHIPTLNSALGDLLAVCMRRVLEVVFLWVILKCVEHFIEDAN
jgi:hypothetical protein